MAWEAGIRTIPGQVAAGDLSTHQHKFMKFSSGKVTVCTAAGEKSIGVLQDNPDTVDKTASVAYTGQSKVLSGAAVTVGDKLKCDATARAVPAAAANVDATSASTTEPVKGSNVMGTALLAASGAGELITMDINPEGLVPGTDE